MGEITMDQLRALLTRYISDNYKTQAAFARSVKMSPAHVSGVLSGRKAVPLAWAELVGAKIEVRVSIDQTAAEWARRHADVMQSQPFPAFVGHKPCLACGEFHMGNTGLPCPRMTPVARGGEHG